MKILTAAETRDVDRLTTERHGIPSLTLMENAGRSVAEFIRQRFPNLAQRKILVLCGKGNNGGDGLVVAQHIRYMSAKPLVCLFAEPAEMHGEAGVNLQRWQDDGGELDVVLSASDWQAQKPALASAGIIVDALLGTGIRGAVEGLLCDVIKDVNRRREDQFVVAVDIPSGLPADTGPPAALGGAIVEANYTITFTAPKVGMVTGAAEDFVGQLLVRDIGSPPELIEEVGKGNLRWSEPREFARFAIPRKPEGHKGDYGHALIVAGSVGKSGAAVMASWAALRAGAGLVTVATPEPVLPIIAAHTPEIMTEPLPATATGSIALGAFESGRFDEILKGKRVIGMGPGLSTQTETQEFVRTVARKETVPIVLDADGLNGFDGRAAELKNAAGKIALTPHPGEMARLAGCTTGEIQARRLELACKCAAEWNVHVVLKGHQTVIAAPGGTAFVNSTGNPGMGTGGTGDVLTGVLAGLTAQYGTDDWLRVLAFGVYLHGLAGDLAYQEFGEAPLMATDLTHFLPMAYAKFYAESGRG